jgi:hypothetical protein
MDGTAQPQIETSIKILEAEIKKRKNVESTDEE